MSTGGTMAAGFGKGDELSESVKARSERTIPRVLVVTKMYKESGKLVSEDTTEEMVEVLRPEEGVPLAEVGYECRMTFNLGNFESVQIGGSIKLPAYLSELDAAFSAAKKFVDGKVSEEAASIHKHRREKTGK